MPENSKQQAEETPQDSAPNAEAAAGKDAAKQPDAPAAKAGRNAEAAAAEEPKSKPAPKAKTAKRPKPKQPPAGAKYFRGTGRRKNAIATVKLYNTPGQGGMTVNDKPIEDILRVDEWVQDAIKPLHVTELMDDVTISARSYGGGLHGQAGALSLGIARALLAMNGELRPVLRQHSLLTRDARARESKKYGLKRARKAPQYTKR